MEKIIASTRAVQTQRTGVARRHQSIGEASEQLLLPWAPGPLRGTHNKLAYTVNCTRPTPPSAGCRAALEAETHRKRAGRANSQQPRGASACLVPQNPGQQTSSGATICTHCGGPRSAPTQETRANSGELAQHTCRETGTAPSPAGPPGGGRARRKAHADPKYHVQAARSPPPTAKPRRSPTGAKAAGTARVNGRMNGDGPRRARRNSGPCHLAPTPMNRKQPTSGMCGGVPGPGVGAPAQTRPRGRPPSKQRTPSGVRSATHGQ